MSRDTYEEREMWGRMNRMAMRLAVLPFAVMEAGLRGLRVAVRWAFGLPAPDDR
jgi:hypothetical protein